MRKSSSSRTRTRLLGQHMLISDATAERIVDSANIGPNDCVLEIGTGAGILTRKLLTRAAFVRSYEVDGSLFSIARNMLLPNKNLDLVHKDAFKVPVGEQVFDICVTSLPYSQSLRFAKWLVLRSHEFKRIVAVVQSEFANKLCATPGEDSYRAVSVLAQVTFKIEKLFLIRKEAFNPPPRVQSQCVSLTPRNDVSQPFFNLAKIRALDYLFSFRNRFASAALGRIFDSDRVPPSLSGLMETRVKNLQPMEFQRILNSI